MSHKGGDTKASDQISEGIQYLNHVFPIKVSLKYRFASVWFKFQAKKKLYQLPLLSVFSVKVNLIHDILRDLLKDILNPPSE